MSTTACFRNVRKFKLDKSRHCIVYSGSLQYRALFSTYSAEVHAVVSCIHWKIYYLEAIH
eukprot:5191-Heterococcus_DN1.PRE.4